MLQATLMIALASTLAFGNQPAQSAPVLGVLSFEQDAYYPLAQEIAAEENAPLFTDPQTALAAQPDALVWVVEPSRLSDAQMVAMSQAMLAAPNAPALGVITGSTLEKARALWRRGASPRGDAYFAVNAANPAAHIDEGRIIEFTENGAASRPLDKPALVAVLQQADYVTFTGHGANGYLRLDEDTTLTAVDVPALPPLVVSTGSCQTVRPWNPGSIALQFIDQGAAAYSGFVFSPIDGYLFGEFDDLPYRYTWPDFPIGRVAQARNRGALQGYAALPYQYLLGDPRIALSSQPPYQILEDQTSGSSRVIRLGQAASGLIPIRVAQGAQYEFVSVAGVASASDHDRFYNNSLQMINHGDDKYLLVIQPGGELTIELRRRAPWHWALSDTLSDSLDHALIFAQQSGGDALSLIFSVLPLAWVARQGFKKRLSRSLALRAAGAGLAAAALQGLYIALRLGRITITSKQVVFSPLSLLACFLLVFAGCCVFLLSRSWRGRLLATFIAIFSVLAPLLLTFSVFFIFNEFLARPEVTTALYNYAFAQMYAVALVIIIPLAYALVRLARKIGWRASS